MNEKSKQFIIMPASLNRLLNHVASVKIEILSIFCNQCTRRDIRHLLPSMVIAILIHQLRRGDGQRSQQVVVEAG